jgi:haloacetate dehalogenase
MYSGFSKFDVSTEPDVMIHGVHGGSGPAILFLHGFPQDHHMWHRAALALSPSYTIVALDLRGYGSSSAPKGSESHIEYSKKTMARDCALVMAARGIKQYYVCGHDRGARVAHKLSVDYPENILKVVFLDICPTLVMYAKANKQFAETYYHWFWLTQPAPFPENMISSNPLEVANQFLGGPDCSLLKIYEPEALEAYYKLFDNPAIVHAMCEEYRAGGTIDLVDASADVAAARQVKCLILVLWGRGGMVGRTYDAIEEWKAVSETGDVRGEPVDCSHYIADHAPKLLVRHLGEFFN